MLAAGAAFSLAQGQYFRSHKYYSWSQIAQQAWRFSVLILIVLAASNVGYTPIALDMLAAGAIVAISAVGWLVIIFQPRFGDNIEPDRHGHYQIALRFFFTNIILSLALFGEQIVVNKLGSASEAAVYFTHMTYFLFPISIVTTFVGFRIGPWIRDNPERFQSLRSRYAIHIHVVIAATVALAFLVGTLGWYIVNPTGNDPDPFVLAAFFLSAAMRTYYIFPSAVNGIFGTTKNHDLLIVSQVVVLAVIATGLAYSYASVSIVYVAAAAGAINWCVRTLIASLVMKSIMSQRVVQSNWSGRK